MATQANYDGFGSDVKGFAVLIQNSDSTNKIVVLDNSGGSKAVRVEQLTVCSDDTSNRTVSFFRLASAVDYYIGTKVVTALAGTDGVVDRAELLISPTGVGYVGTLDQDGLPCLWLPAGQKLDASVAVAVTAAKFIYISGVYREFL